MSKPKVESIEQEYHRIVKATAKSMWVVKMAFLFDTEKYEAILNRAVDDTGVLATKMIFPHRSDDTWGRWS